MINVRKMIVDATSDMLDNPDEHDIYPTTKFYDRLEKEIGEYVEQENTRARMNEHHVLSRMMSNDDLRLVPDLVAAFKRRFAELKAKR